MNQQRHQIRVGNTRSALCCILSQPNENGIDTVVDLNGKTVRFGMVNAATSEVVVADTGLTNIEINDASAGKVQYDFQPSDVENAGYFYGTFNVYDGSEFDSFPVATRGLRIEISSPIQTAKQAYDAAVSAL